MSRAPQEPTSADPQSTSQYLAAWHATMKLIREGHSFSGRERNCAFLNCGPQARFANVSAVSGLDFADDGRVVAMVDWDHDGDLDVWLHNRTGPRLRLMQNQTIQSSRATPHGGENKANFVSVRLRGTKVNRDAIGARVEVLFEDPNLPPLMRTLYAGDAYLSQSSKWLHFGLGAEELVEIRALRVRWPGGAVEDFSNVAAGHRFLLVEGTGQAHNVDERREVTLAATEQKPTIQASSSRVLLFNRPPVPMLNVTSIEDRTSQRLEFSNRPTLMVLWASWCATCRRELQELSQRQREFDVVAVAVDEVAKSESTELTLSQIVSQWQLPFPVVSATPEMLDKLQLLGRVALNRQTPLAVPTAFLIDGEGRLAAVYRGKIEMTQLASDVALLGANVLARRDMAIPYKGKWTTPPTVLLLRPVAKIFRERGYTEDYARYLRIEMDQWRARRASASTAAQKEQLDRQFANDNFNLAHAHEQEKDWAEAIDYYRQGLAVLPGDPTAWLRLAHCLQAVGNEAVAIDELRSGIAKASITAELRIELAKLLRSQEDYSGAKDNLTVAIADNPSSPKAHFHLGILCLAQGDVSASERAFRAALSVDPDHFESLLNLGAVLASRGATAEAIGFLEHAVRLKPNDTKARLNLAQASLAVGDNLRSEKQLRAALTLEPGNAQVHLGLAQLSLATKQPKKAAEHLASAVRINPDDTASTLRLAWLLATSAESSVRDSQRALVMAKQLNQQTQGTHPLILDTLAAAHAASGDFAAGQAAARQAIEILEKAKQEEMANEVRQRMELYRNGRPFVQAN